MRDFNGYSWNTIPREIESICHNLIYQNIRILVGNEFLNKWIKNKEYIIDYMESFQNKLEDRYGNKLQQKVVEYINQISVLLAVRYNPKIKTKLEKDKKEVESKLERIKDNKKFVKEITEEKQQLTKEIKLIDETLNNKNMLQKEYEKRNQDLPLQDKIFSSKILSKMMVEEREEKIKKIEKLNKLLTPQKFVKYKKELEAKEKYLRLLDIEKIDNAISSVTIALQKEFLNCYKTKIEKIETKQELVNLIYEFRYYCLIPFNSQKTIGQVNKILDDIKKIQDMLIEKAHELKVIELFSKDKEIDHRILSNIFYVRVINLEDLYIRITKENDSYYVGLFDENVFEEKVEIEQINAKDLIIKTNKKIKIFNF